MDQLLRVLGGTDVVGILLTLAGTFFIVRWFHRRQLRETVRAQTRFGFDADKADHDPESHPDHPELWFGGRISNRGAYNFDAEMVEVEVLRGGETVLVKQGDVLDPESPWKSIATIEPGDQRWIGTLITESDLPYSQPVPTGQGYEYLVKVRARIRTLAGEILWTDWDEAEHFLKMGPEACRKVPAKPPQ